MGDNMAREHTAMVCSAGKLYEAVESMREETNESERVGKISRVHAVVRRQVLTRMRGTMNQITRHLRAFELEVEQIRRGGGHADKEKDNGSEESTEA